MTAAKEYKQGQQQGTQDFHEGPHRRFTNRNSSFSAGYCQAYDLAEAEAKHQSRHPDVYGDGPETPGT